MSTASYKADLERHCWEYWRNSLGADLSLLDEGREIGGGPAVLRAELSSLNILVPPDRSGVHESILGEVPVGNRHRWFRSFNSSQALAQTVFANLKHLGKLGILQDLHDVDGLPVFGNGTDGSLHSMEMEHSVTTLGERAGRTTEVDVFFGGDYSTCVECKLVETGVGACSKADQRRKGYGDDAGRCDGSFSLQLLGEHPKAAIRGHLKSGQRAGSRPGR